MDKLVNKIVKAFSNADSALFALHSLLDEEDRLKPFSERTELWRDVYRLRVVLNQQIKAMWGFHDPQRGDLMISRKELTIWETVIMIELEKNKSAQQAIETADVIIEARRLRFTNDPQT